jgi:dolichol-phosphate mannosyltransferase
MVRFDVADHFSHRSPDHSVDLLMTRNPTRSPAGARVSVVIPTYNEAGSITDTLSGLRQALVGWASEIIVVDDSSPDGTADVVERAGRTTSTGPTIRVIRRQGRRGLARSVVEGFDAASGDIIAVMDGDGQHDPAVLPIMAGAVLDGADVCVGSRRLAEGGFGTFARRRQLLSRAGDTLVGALIGHRSSDPLSGYFALSRPHLERCRPKLKARGFKILLEVLALGDPLVLDVPIVFRTRQHGRSKLQVGVLVVAVSEAFRLAMVRVRTSYPQRAEQQRSSAEPCRQRL